MTTKTVIDPWLDWCDENIDKLKEISKDGHQYFVLKLDEGLVFYTRSHDQFEDYVNWIHTWCTAEDVFMSNTNLYV